MSMLNEADPTAPESDPVGKLLDIIVLEKEKKHSMCLSNHMVHLNCS